MTRLRAAVAALAAAALLPAANAYRVNIRDTDELREVCSGMYGGKDAYIELSFADFSVGQLSLIVYEWKDVGYLGAETPDADMGSSDLPKTYICTTAAIRSGLCTSSDLGSFITTLPSGVSLNQTSIFTSGVRFDPYSFPSGGDTIDMPPEDADPTFEEVSSIGEDVGPGAGMTATGTVGSRPPYQTGNAGDISYDDGSEEQGDSDIDAEQEAEDAAEELYNEILNGEDGFGKRQAVRSLRRRQSRIPHLRIGYAGGQGKRQINDDDYEEIGDVEVIGVDDEGNVIVEDLPIEVDEEGDVIVEYPDGTVASEDDIFGEDADTRPTTTEDWYDEEYTSTSSTSRSRPTSSSYKNKPTTSEGISEGSSAVGVPVYTAPIVYHVRKTGYYCVGVVPVTLVNSKRATVEDRQAATHAEYGGTVLFRNQFVGELPAAEYPKIGFYGFLSLVYVCLAAGWGFLCFRFRKDLLPMQLYISGTIVFLVIEMIANWAYYRYINKHGGSAGSLAFLFVVAILNAGRNSLSFFLLLIVSMGLSVVTPSLGPIMNRVRLLTIVHFIFGVLYSIGTVRVELETASLFLVLFLIFPLALTLTAFLMWTILSLNGTITHLAARKQRNKLQMFKRLYRILMIAVIAVAGFFVISSLSLSNRLDEDYAPKNWKYRWILLDASLATIYLCVFAAIAYLWRPSRDNLMFAMSQELPQDEAEADADDYEINDLEANRRPMHDGEEDGYGDESTGFINGNGSNGHPMKQQNVVFALEDEDSDGEGGHKKAREEYKDLDEDDSRKRD